MHPAAGAPLPRVGHPTTPRGDDPLGATLARAVRERSRDVPAPAAAVLQRFAEVRRGARDYPEKWHYSALWFDSKAGDEETFFTHQRSTEGKYLDEARRATIERVAAADLLVSDDGHMAIENCGDTTEAKTFFAIHELIAHANDALKGAVRLQITNRYLWYKGARLFEVEPVVATQRASGVDVRTPQNCNVMAGFVSGSRGLGNPGDDQVAAYMAAAIDAVTPESRREADLTAAYRNAFGPSPVKGGRDVYFPMLEGVIEEFHRLAADEVTRTRMLKALEARGLNARLSPRQGDAIVIWSAATGEQSMQAQERGVDPFPYHFATVVVASGSDYVTLENYARRQGTTTATSGDPLFFFKMYGTGDRAQTFHAKQLESPGIIGVPLSYVWTPGVADV